jgi:2-polyprenyl-3-methyl-5-hydroxy-6-metoxy-1,4-benzoquinol methylase
MMICPDCYKALDLSVGTCNSCSWNFNIEDEIPVCLSTKDKEDEMFKKYLDNYNEISLDDLEETIQNEVYLKSQNDKLFSYLPSLQGLNVCEVGIGKGNLLANMLKEKPAKLVGIDISRPYLEAIKKKSTGNLELIIANAENIPFENEFDVIVAADILEHVFNVGDFLASVNRALKPSGRFIVKTPHNEDINGYSKLRGCKYNFVHLRNFNKKTLTTVLKGAGFEPHKVIYDGFYPDRIRNQIKKFSFLHQRCNKYFEKNFESIHHVNKINNFIGNVLMDPIEITAVSIKKMDVKITH